MPADRIRLALGVYSLGAQGGGVTRFTIDLARQLDPDLFEVKVCSLGYYGTAIEDDCMDDLLSSGITPITGADWNPDKPYQSFWNSYRAFRMEFLHNPVDIFHSHSEFSDITALLLKFERKTPRIIRTFHNGHRLEWRKRPIRRILLTNFLYPLYYDAEIGVSRPIAQRLSQRRLARILGQQGLHLSNAINLDRFKPTNQNKKSVRAEFGLPEDAYLVGTIGRLESEKGINDFIEAAGIVTQNRLPDVYFAIVGSGSMRQTLEEQANRLGISDRVIFTGPRSDIEAILAGLDVYVCSSLWEGLPTAVLESMAANVPVIATDIPGNQAIIENGINGVLIPVQKPEALANAIHSLLTSPQLRNNYSARSLITVKNFSIEKVARDHEALYRSVLNRASSLPDDMQA